MRADILVTPAVNVTFTGAGTNYLIQTPTGVLYCVFVDQNADVAYKKSSDGGLSWSIPIIVFAGTVTQLSVWYDRWSNISAGLIHCAYVDSTLDDVFYRTINTESSDALSTETTIFLGASTALGCALSICRSRGGNVYCYAMIDAGAEGGFFRLPNANVPNGAWDAARTNPETLASGDMIILQPGWAADNQDMMAFYWDASANEVSRYVYDDSANSWAETSIATSMTEAASTGSFPHFAAAVDITNSQSLLVAWNAVDTVGADLRCWNVTESAINTAGNVALNSIDDQGLCAIGIATDTGHWHAFYAGASDGSETFTTAVNVYTTVSTDSGTTWGPETLVTTVARDTAWLVTAPRFTGTSKVAFHSNTVSVDELLINVKVPQRRAIHQMFGG
jgi:hypothetical protein